MRALAAGLAAGIALSLARAPLGLDLAQAPALSPGTALGWRGLALAALALAIGRYGGGHPRLGTLAAGAALGFALHGLLLANLVSLSGSLQLLGVLLLLVVVFAITRPRASDGDLEPEPRASLLERFGLLIAGAGGAIALESVTRALRVLSEDSPADESVFGALFLALLAFGAGAFGPLVPRRQRGAAAGALVALGALACIESLRTLGSFATREVMDAFFRQAPWRLDLSEVGRLDGDLLLGARAFLLPAFALGAALFVSARGSRLAWIVFGAAIGHFMLPSVLARTAGAEPGLAAATRAACGAGLAGFGGLLASALARSTPSIGRIAGALVSAAVAAVALFGVRAVGVPLTPWARMQVAPDLVLDSPAGLMTIEPTIDFAHVVTLDRHRLTPAASGEAADAQRLRLAWNRVDPAALTLKERRVLLVGQLTPLRARTLLELGASHIDRTGAWHAQMEELESRLFEGAERPAGRILAPSELSGAGPWVLAIAPPVERRSPLARGLRAGSGAVPSVVWIEARAQCAQRDWGERVLISSQGIDDVCIAPAQPLGFASGDPVRVVAPWSWLRMRPFERETASVAVTLGRLSAASKGSASEQVTEGLARLAAVQVRSSPFESEAQRVEVEYEALRLLREAALAGPPDLFLRDLWNALAALLVEKREIEFVDQYVAPIAERWAPWWQLEVALARAELEGLDPEAAAQHYLRALQERSFDLQLRLDCAKALSMAEQPQAAIEQLRAIDTVQPGRRDVRRLMAMELARAGDPGAPPLLEELLREDPSDEELRAFQGTGPFPPPRVEFSPTEGVRAHGGA